MSDEYNDESWLPDHLQTIDEALNNELKLRQADLLSENERLKEQVKTARQQKADDLSRFEGPLAKISDLEALVAKGEFTATQQAGLEYLRSLHQDGITVGDKCYWVSPTRERQRCHTCKGAKDFMIENYKKINCPNCNGQGTVQVLVGHEIVEGYINAVSFSTEDGYDEGQDRLLCATTSKGVWSYSSGHVRTSGGSTAYVLKDDMRYSRKSAEQRLLEVMATFEAKEALTND